MELNQVFRAKEATYIRYSIVEYDGSSLPCHHTGRGSDAAHTDAAPLASLKNHQLRHRLQTISRRSAAQPLTV